MRRLSRVLTAGVLFLAVHDAPSWAQTVRYRITPTQGMFGFKATSRFVNADGRFRRFEGEVRVDPNALDQGLVSLTIDAASVDTGIGQRDDHLRSEDFFHVARFPQITFTSRRVSQGDGKLLVTGRLTLHGVTREITVPVELEPGSRSLRARGEFTIRMSDYGMNYRSFFNPIRDEVRIRFDLSGSPDGAPDLPER